MDKFISKIKKDFTKNQHMGRYSWKSQEDTLFLESQVETTLQILKKILSEKATAQISILSPTANTASLEARMFKKLKQEKEFSNISFIAGDVADIAIDKEVFNNDVLYARFDALNLPFKDNSIDILFDKKGLLWFACEYKKIDKITESLEEYFRILKEDGEIIIDAIKDEYSILRIDKNRDDAKCDNIPWIQNMKEGEVLRILQREPSTYSLLLHTLNCNEDFKDYFQANYKHELISIEKPYLFARITKISSKNKL